MEKVLRAFEATGTIDDQKQLHLDTPLPINGPSRVRVIILMPEETDIDEREWLKWLASNPAYDFLRDSDEDIYTLEHGKPYHAQG